MRFDEYRGSTVTVGLSGGGLVGIYSLLLEREAALDADQRQALEAIRGELYGRFTIEEMETLHEQYARYHGSSRL